jgi:pimeloyl-ACP methyl ester carboxylesterase
MAEEDRGPLLLLNGGRPGVLASWDVDRPGPSVAALFARAGHTVYLMDARGFGRSEFTEDMADGAEAGPIAVRSHEVVRDIAAVIHMIREHHPSDDRLAGLGWATGSQWLGHYASLYPKSLSHLIYYQGAYGGEPGGWPFQSIASPDDPTRLDRTRFPAFRCSTAQDVIGRLGDETDNQAFLTRYSELAMEGDEQAETRDPPCFRFPSGPLADTLMMVNGRPLFDAGVIESHVLILRSEHDFWSRTADVAALRDHLDQAASVTVKELAGASHYIHLLPEERGAFVEAVLRFTATEHQKEP